MSDEVCSNAPYGDRSAEAVVFKKGLYFKNATHIIAED